MKEYTPDMIFNADKTGLYYRMIPKITYASYNNDPVGTKKARELVTINTCANLGGHGKSKWHNKTFLAFDWIY